MLTVEDANEAKCERKPEMNHPAMSLAFASTWKACTCACLYMCVCPGYTGSRLRRTKLGLTLSLLCLKLLTVFNFTSYRASLCLSVGLCTVEATPGDKLCQALG